MPRRRQPRRLPAQRHPQRIEDRYAASLTAATRAYGRLVERELAPVLERYERLYASRQDQEGLPTLGALGVEVLQVIGPLRLVWERRISADDWRERVLTTAKQVERFNRRSVSDQVKAVLGLDPTSLYSPAQLDRWLRDHASLIKSIGPKYLDQVQTLVLEAMREGTRPETLATRLQERTGVAESRARLIAEDQVQKLNAALTEQRHRDLGVERYIWRTSRDARVRDAHREREGKRYRYDSPPEDGHPGQPVRCRCRAEPDLQHLLEASAGGDWTSLRPEGPRGLPEPVVRGRRRGA